MPCCAKHMHGVCACVRACMCVCVCCENTRPLTALSVPCSFCFSLALPQGKAWANLQSSSTRCFYHAESSCMYCTVKMVRQEATGSRRRERGGRGQGQREEKAAATLLRRSNTGKVRALPWKPSGKFTHQVTSSAEDSTAFSEDDLFSEALMETGLRLGE